ncbi:lytic transglycosylase domain-containing protein [Mariprofundus ferrooxydans]|uniref:Membrane-bound lytic murein transglycosylase D n=1 Tax=Mariprofundus ferrooxydans PV-1 TaxID=314345 RepID=Q0F260_9PROT|nr:lytic transglycosylase domain-containing protein [Mariprofundus ferrooxydans]EAU55690.1 membrane-bound lytic murein transglycosylase D precursor [Mariprofundus ferrooxydans PV-1]
MNIRDIRTVILLASLTTFSACAQFNGGSSFSDWFRPPPPPATAVATPPPSPFLADLSEGEIASVKAEAMRVYGPSWQRISERSRYVRQPLVETLARYGAPIALQMIPVVESGYNPYARSEVGATGLWQLMPETATDLRIRSNKLVDGRRDIEASTRGAAHFLLKQYARFGSWPLAFAAYHLGPSGVQRRIDRHPWHNGDGLRRLPLPPITKTYIRHILGLIALQRDGQLLLPPPYPTSTVVIHSPVDLERLHNVAGMRKNQLFRFNPKLARMQYYHDRPKQLSLRITQKGAKRVHHIIPSAASNKLYIRVQRGESIAQISRHYRVSVYVLKKENPELVARGLRQGMRLNIPVKDLSRAKITANPLIKKPSPELAEITTVATADL